MHWYKQDGTPCYEVPYANPKNGMRPTTLRDAKKLGLVPSVTTVLDILDKPGLNRWKELQILQSALTLPRGKNDSDDIYMAKIRSDAKELSLMARDEGTRIHDAIESVFKDRSIGHRYNGIANNVQRAVIEYFGTSEGWVSEESFAHELGFGGKVDLNNRNINVVLDFKTKEEFKRDKNDKVMNMAYDEQCMQLSAYSKGLNIPGAKLVNVFVDYDGNTVFHEWSGEEKARAYDMFLCCLKLWKLIKRI